MSSSSSLPSGGSPLPPLLLGGSLPPPGGCPPGVAIAFGVAPPEITGAFAHDPSDDVVGNGGTLRTDAGDAGGVGGLRGKAPGAPHPALMSRLRSFFGDNPAFLPLLLPVSLSTALSPSLRVPGTSSPARRRLSCDPILASADLDGLGDFLMTRVPEALLPALRPPLDSDLSLPAAKMAFATPLKFGLGCALASSNSSAPAATAPGASLPAPSPTRRPNTFFIVVEVELPDVGSVVVPPARAAITPSENEELFSALLSSMAAPRRERCS